MDTPIIFGRMPVGGAGDPSEFDFVSRDEADMTPEEAQFLFAGEDEPQPAEEMFPVFASALRRYEAAERPPRAFRVDTDETYADFVSDSAAREIERRLTVLESGLAAHMADPLAHPHTHDGAHMRAAVRETVLGLQAAETTGEAISAMPQVPVPLPNFARSAVRCWRDGDAVVVSVRFCAADGSPRIASMVGRPEADDVLGAYSGASVRSGVGLRLVRDVAGCALRAHDRPEVLGMGDEPVVLASSGTVGTAPVAALVHVQQLADAGHTGAQREMLLIRSAAQTPLGQRYGAPALAEADRRLAAARARNKPSLFKRIAGWFK